MVSEKKIFLSFSHFMGTISWHGGHLDLWTVTIFTNFQSLFNTWLHIKIGVSEEKSFKGVNGQVDNRRRVITIVHPEPLAQVS